MDGCGILAPGELVAMLLYIDTVSLYILYIKLKLLDGGLNAITEYYGC
jgi:hypothetical protein